MSAGDTHKYDGFIFLIYTDLCMRKKNKKYTEHSTDILC
jgi:hypothetical protein